MAIKMFKCEICGDDVTKPQSYSLGDGKGRACRKHEEAQVAREATQKAEVSAREQLNKQKYQLRGKPGELLTSMENAKKGVYNCNCCDKLGYYQEYAAPLFRKLIAIHGLKERSDQAINGNAPNLTVEQAAIFETVKPYVLAELNAATGMDIDSLLVSVPSEYVKHKRVLPKYQGFVRLAGIVVVCEKCFADTVVDVANKILEEG